MKITQNEIILKLLASQPETWFKSYSLRGRYTPWGFCGHQADRRCRDLAAAGKIDVKHQGKYAEYRAKEKELLKPEPQRPPQVLPQFAREFVNQSRFSF